MPKQVTVTLGGRSYAISEKPSGINMKWRKKMRATSLMSVFESLDGLVTDLMVVVGSVSDGGKISDIDIGKALGVARVLPAMVNGLSNSIDDIIDLLFEYEPKLKTDRKWLDENAYDEEYVRAFLEMLKLLFPIMGIWEMVAGFQGRQTPGNSPSVNGALNGLPASGPKKKALTSS